MTAALDTATSGSPAPFIKWAGGKRRLLPQILKLLPPLDESRRYFEPFLGGAAVFFGLGPRHSVLSDVNHELVEVFTAVRDDVDSVIDHLSGWKNEEELYYRVRGSRPRSAASRAARFIYLNKTCFNGLFRVNLKGDFNVPFGRHGPNLVICDELQLRAASETLKRATLAVADFGQSARRMRTGDLAYFDPPYTTAHSNNGFIEYNARVFSWEDQRRLARVCKALVARGVRVAVSNADHPAIRCLYPRDVFNIRRLDRWSTMAGGPSKRFPTTELLIVSRKV